MKDNRQSKRQLRRVWSPCPFSSLFAVLLLGLCLMSVAEAGSAGAGAIEIKKFSIDEIFAFLLLMLGPFKIIAPFLKLTEGADDDVVRRTALQATVFSSAALLLAALSGERIIAKYGIPLPMLTLAAGIILFLVALRSILHQFESVSALDVKEPSTPSIRTAMTPLAFPTIVTPYGIAAVVLFVAISPDTKTTTLIGFAVLLIMAINLIAMLAARRLQVVLAIVLPILGVVVGVVQVAFGLKIIDNSMRAIGIY